MARNRHRLSQCLLSSATTLLIGSVALHAVAQTASFDGVWHVDLKAGPNPEIHLSIPIEIKDGKIRGVSGQPGTRGYVEIIAQISETQRAGGRTRNRVDGEIIELVSLNGSKTPITGVFSSARDFGDISCKHDFSTETARKSPIQNCSGIFRRGVALSSPSASAPIQAPSAPTAAVNNTTPNPFDGTWRLHLTCSPNGFAAARDSILLLKLEGGKYHVEEGPSTAVGHITLDGMVDKNGAGSTLVRQLVQLPGRPEGATLEERYELKTSFVGRHGTGSALEITRGPMHTCTPEFIRVAAMNESSGSRLMSGAEIPGTTLNASSRPDNKDLCVGNDVTTLRRCLDDNFELADKHLNDVYKKTIDRLDPSAQQRLRADERARIKRRDSDCQLARSSNVVEKRSESAVRCATDETNRRSVVVEAFQ